MRTFAIKDEDTNRTCATLLYFRDKKMFFILLEKDSDEWNTPLLLSSYAKRGLYFVGPMDSLLWVKQRIVPTDRQNLGDILKRNHMESYDEFRLLELARGRCVQDNYYIEEVKIPKLDLDEKIDYFVDIGGNQFLIVFEDGQCKSFQLQKYCEKLYREKYMSYLFQHKENARLLPEGLGISFDNIPEVTCEQVLQNSEPVPFSADALGIMMKNQLITTAEAAEILSCSRQNIDDYIKKGKLVPVKKVGKTTLFLRSDVEKYLTYS